MQPIRYQAATLAKCRDESKIVNHLKTINQN